MPEINLLLKLKNAIGDLINPAREETLVGVRNRLPPTLGGKLDAESLSVTFSDEVKDLIKLGYPQLADANNFLLTNSSTTQDLLVDLELDSGVLTSSGLFLPGMLGSYISGVGIPSNSIITKIESTNIAYFSAPFDSKASITGSTTATLISGGYGTYTLTRPEGIIRQLVVLSSRTKNIPGVFCFQYSEDGIDATITEVRPIGDFSTVRDFDLQNAGQYFRILFAPKRVLSATETVVTATTLKRTFDGSFVRLANQEIEEANAAMGQTFAFFKGFDAITGKSVNIRPSKSGALRTRDDNLTTSQSGSLFVEGIRDDISIKFSRDFGLDAIADDIRDVNSVNGSVTHDPLEGQAIFAITGDPGAVCYFESVKTAVYEPGHMIRGGMTIQISELPTGDSRIEWGWGEPEAVLGSNLLHNGIGFGVDAVGFYVFRKKNGVYQNGTPTYTFNRDFLDGSTSSLYKYNDEAVPLNVLLNGIYEAEFEWYGVAPPTYLTATPYGFPLIFHQEETAGRLLGTTIPEPNIPMFVRLQGDSTTGQALSVRCGSVRGGLVTSKTVNTGKDPNNDFVDERVQGTHNENSVEIALEAFGTYRGAWFPWQKNYIKLVSDLVCDVDCTFYIDFSERLDPDEYEAVNGLDSAIDGTPDILEYHPEIETLLNRQTAVSSKWVRHRVIMGQAAGTARLDAAFLTADPGGISQSLARLPLRTTKAIISRTVQAVLTADGTAYQELPVASDGAPKSHVTAVDGDVLLRAMSLARTRGKVVGIQAVQIDTGPLNDRRCYAVANDETTNKGYIGFSSDLNVLNGFPVPAGRVVIANLAPGVQLWGIAKNTGSGTQTDQSLVGTSGTGSATNPTNARVLDSNYSNITATGQNVVVGGFSITPTASASIQNVLIGAWVKKQSATFQTVEVVETRTGNSSNIGTITTDPLNPFSSGTTRTFLAWYSTENASKVVISVVGLGLTWTKVGVADAGTDRRIELWKAVGNPDAGLVTFNCSTTSGNNHISVTCYSGGDQVGPIQDFATATGTSTTPSVTGVDASNHGMLVMGVVMDNNTFTANTGNGFTLVSSETTPTGGSRDGLGVQRKAITSTGTYSADGTTSGSVHWAAIAASIQPAPARDPLHELSYKLSGVVGATKLVYELSSIVDVYVELDITNDRTWSYANIPNLEVVDTGSMIYEASVDVNQLLVKVVETTAPTCDFRLMEIGEAPI